MRSFELLEPQSVAEASRMLADGGEQARLLAGGTFLILGTVAPLFKNFLSDRRD